MTIEGTPLPLTPPFMVLATQNPIEQEGTYALPEAQLDRFLMKVHIGFPTEDNEKSMVRQVTANQVGDRLNVEAVATLVKPETVLTLQQVAARLTVDDAVLDYAVRIVRATRTWSGVAAGAGPRGTIALIRDRALVASSWAAISQFACPCASPGSFIVLLLSESTRSILLVIP